MQTTKPPQVSCIIPCYNQGRFVTEAVNSCLNSKFQDIEVIVVNDGSTDAFTNYILRNLHNPKIKVIQQQNRGLPAARNRAISEARGKYIMPLDADDMIEQSYIDKAYKIMEKTPEIGFVSCYGQLFGDICKIWKPPQFNFYKLLFMNIITTSSLFRKKAWEEVGGYNEKLVGYQDWDFWISVAEKGWVGYQIQEPLFLYRKHGETMLSRSQKIHHQLVEEIRKSHPDLYSEESLQRLRKVWTE